MENQETNPDKIYFFGWTNIKWLIRELVKLASGEPSYFSLKRFDRIFIMGLALGAYYYYFKTHIPTMDASSFLMVVSPLFVYAGYSLDKTQKEKKDLRDIENNSKPEAPADGEVK